MSKQRKNTGNKKEDKYNRSPIRLKNDMKTEHSTRFTYRTKDKKEL